MKVLHSMTHLDRLPVTCLWLHSNSPLKVNRIVNERLQLAVVVNKPRRWRRKVRFFLYSTVAVVEEVGDGRRGAAAPGLGGVDGGEDGGHEPLVAVDAEALLAELGVVVGQAEQVTWETGDGRRFYCLFFLGRHRRGREFASCLHRLQEWERKTEPAQVTSHNTGEILITANEMC